MPKVFSIYGYHIFFYSRENSEPCHVHIAKSHTQKLSSKVWVEVGNVSIAHNKARIPQKTLTKILDWIAEHANDIVDLWNDHFSC